MDGPTLQTPDWRGLDLGNPSHRLVSLPVPAFQSSALMPKPSLLIWSMRLLYMITKEIRDLQGNRGSFKINASNVDITLLSS